MSIETKRHPGKQQTGTVDVPEIMHAAAIDRFGGPEVLTLHELPLPALEKGEVLIAVETAGVGSWDVEMRAGWYPGGHHPKFPLVLGTDGSGLAPGAAEALQAATRVLSGVALLGSLVVQHFG